MKKQRLLRLAVFAVVPILAFTLYSIWHMAPAEISPPSGITQQNFSPATNSKTAITSTDTAGTIQVYVAGAVKHPGVYTLDANARVYQLLKAAGGPMPNANLVALNLAAKLNDGQEVYVISLGETPPTSTGGVPNTGSGSVSGTGSGSSLGTGTNATGQLVNINTASADELKQSLHVSATTAQNILNYRVQHGNFTSIDQLLQVVSKTIYNKIKGMVTV